MTESIRCAAALRSRTVQMLALASALVPLAFATPSTAAGRGSTGAYDSDVARAWFDLALDLTKTTTGFSPPVASRAFGYLGVTLYEAVVPGMRQHRSLEGQLNGLKGLPKQRASLHWPTAANAALAAMARDLYAGSTVQAAQNLAAIDALEEDLQRGFARAPQALEARSAAFGRDVAAAIIAWAHGDGGHEGHLRNFPADFVPPVAPGLWVPTPPAFQRALQPFWGSVRPFALPSASFCSPGAPIPYSEDPASAFYAEALEVHDAVANLTPEQLVIARFWSDDPGATATPPGHSISILTQVLHQEGSQLDVAAEGYARVGIAVADAFISCWWTKFRYNLLRPITYIQAHIDSGWTPPLNTPPFAEYSSGHSAQSGAAAEVLTALFGELAFTDETHVDRGFDPRSFDSFHAFADEAAMSRLLGGIHFRAAIERGLVQGRCVGMQVNAIEFHE